MSTAPRGPKRRSRAEAAAETRDLLLASAKTVFVERGYHGASIYEIAERAGRTIGALYSHFGGKEAVFFALVDRHFEEQLKRYAQELANAKPGRSAEAGAGFWVEFLDEDPELFILFIEFWSYAVRDPELRRRFADSYRKLRSQLAALIDGERKVAGVQTGPPAEEAAIVFDALIDGFALHRIVDPDQVEMGLLARALDWLARGMNSAPRQSRRARVATSDPNRPPR